jgi:beta-lactamase
VIMAKVFLKDIAHGRSGDKGDTSNICVFARDPNDYLLLERELTVERIRAHFGEMVKGDIVRYEVPSLYGFNFVLKHALGGGATHSLRLDTLGKSLGSAIMRLQIETGDRHV